MLVRRSANISAIFISRRWLRRLAWLSMLAICLHVVASGIGGIHAAKWLATSHGLAAAEICHGSGASASVDGGESSGQQADGAHCPFCRVAALGIELPSSSALSFQAPEPVALFLPAADAALQPSAPDLRHAPKHGPPALLS
ncbi:MAG: DUF2946 domain-containing protein [Azoarcus sp.]|jgi:hypothetical protein|nr:DUF2946 domain-containing protein [Azoarcus sp.]